MRRGLIAALVAVVVAALAVTTSAIANTSASAASEQAACTSSSIGFLGPLTGPAGFLGQEQISWLKFGVQKFNKEQKTNFKLVEGDTQLKAPVALTVGRKLASNKSVLAVIGGSESQAVRVTGKLFAKTSLANISGSATAIDLTKGHPYKSFFRVIPNDSVQGPDIVSFVSTNLKAKNVVVVDSQDDYSLPLASAITRGLKAKKVTVSRESVSADDTDFSSVVANVSSSVNVVVFATQVATAANTMSNQLREQGKKAIVFGTDGAYSPSQFKPKSGYVSIFAPDLHFDPKAKKIVAEYKKFVKNDTSGAFGPATYQAGWVAMSALKKACADGKATRAEVTKAVKSSRTPSIIGAPTAFDSKGDPRGGAFTIYKITNGKYSPVK